MSEPSAAQGLRIVPTEAEIVSLREEIERVQRRAEKYAAALTEITASRDSFGDDRLYANHAERVAHNALLPYLLKQEGDRG